MNENEHDDVSTTDSQGLAASDAIDEKAPDFPKWKPLKRIERRVVGVLIEKAKTTPDAYPLTLNSITTGCNQKSNRSPQMELDPDDVLICLDHLKELGAVTEIIGTGRVSKYRHNMYQWLGVDKTELAVVAELLLRGGQTLWELRARAARMEPIADIGALRPICKSLMEKSLLVALTPEGRGQIVDHGLYPPNERPAGNLSTRQGVANEPIEEENSAPRLARSSTAATGTDETVLMELRDQIETLSTRLEQLERRFENLESLIT